MLHPQDGVMGRATWSVGHFGKVFGATASEAYVPRMMNQEYTPEDDPSSFLESGWEEEALGAEAFQELPSAPASHHHSKPPQRLLLLQEGAALRSAAAGGPSSTGDGRSCLGHRRRRTASPLPASVERKKETSGRRERAPRDPPVSEPGAGPSLTPPR